MQFAVQHVHYIHTCMLNLSVKRKNLNEADANMQTGIISSSRMQTNSHKATRRAETGRTHTTVRLTEFFIMFLLACQERW